MKDLREQLILQIANGVAIKNGVNQNPMFVEEASTAIIKLADAILAKIENK